MLEKIKKLIHVGKNSKATNLKKAIINDLANHGKEGIPQIIDIISYSKDMTIKKYGFETINKIIERQDKEQTRIITGLMENHHQAR